MTLTEPRIALGPAGRPMVRIFFSIASRDQKLWEPLLDRLNTTLAIVPAYEFVTFDMREILTSEDFLGVIDSELASYHLGIGFLSTAYFNSKVIRGTELATFVERKDARFVPVMLEELAPFAKSLSEIQRRQIYAYDKPWSSLKERERQPWINDLVQAILAVLAKYGDRT